MFIRVKKSYAYFKNKSRTTVYVLFIPVYIKKQTNAKTSIKILGITVYNVYNTVKDLAPNDSCQLKTKSPQEILLLLSGMRDKYKNTDILVENINKKLRELKEFENNFIQKIPTENNVFSLEALNKKLRELKEFENNFIQKIPTENNVFSLEALHANLRELKRFENNFIKKFPELKE